MGIRPEHFESRLAPEPALAALATPGALPSFTWMGRFRTSTGRFGKGKLNQEKNFCPVFSASELNSFYHQHKHPKNRADSYRLPPIFVGNTTLYHPKSALKRTCAHAPLRTRAFCTAQLQRGGLARRYDGFCRSLTTVHYSLITVFHTRQVSGRQLLIRSLICLRFRLCSRACLASSTTSSSAAKRSAINWSSVSR